MWEFNCVCWLVLTFVCMFDCALPQPSLDRSLPSFSVSGLPVRFVCFASSALLAILPLFCESFLFRPWEEL